MQDRDDQVDNATPASATLVPSFLIVGSPRSGTTLLQRLACELPGVAIPPETHFFYRFLPALLKRRRWPLDERDLREELSAYAAMETSKGMQIDADAIVAELGGRCGRPWDLFCALVRHLAGEADVIGEKTPRHLLWWRPLSRTAPLKFVAIVRDPRAVIASNLQAGWFRTPSIPRLADWWSFEQRQIMAASRTLGNDWLTFHYEEVVRNPSQAQKALGAFLGLSAVESVNPGSIVFLPQEEPYKARARGPVTTERIDAWHEDLLPRQAAQVVAICRREMKRLGMETSTGKLDAIVQTARLPLATQMRRLRDFGMLRKRQLWINRTRI